MTANARYRPDRTAIADWTLEQLHELILNGDLAAGDTLTEMDLTQRLGVSRSPVREALKGLENAGLVIVDPINGQRKLRAFGLEDIRESYDIRTELEALAARYAARCASDEQLKDLSDCLEVMRAAIREPLDVWLPADFAFHAAIARASGAHSLPHLLAHVWAQNQAFLRRMDRLGVDPSDSTQRLGTLPVHEEILAAIRSRDEDAAGRVVWNFIRARRDIMLAKLQGGGVGNI
jgi:DNA-binding GntR family transcriptional regulator